MEWEKRRAHVMQRMGIGSSSVGTRRPPQCSRGQYMGVLHCEGVNGTIFDDQRSAAAELVLLESFTLLAVGVSSEIGVSLCPALGADRSSSMVREGV